MTWSCQSAGERFTLRLSLARCSIAGDEDADAELEKRLQKYTGTKDWKKEKAAEGTLPAASKGAR